MSDSEEKEIGKEELRSQRRFGKEEENLKSLTYINTLFSTRGRCQKFHFFDATTRSALLTRSSSLYIIMGVEGTP